MKFLHVFLASFSVLILSIISAAPVSAAEQCITNPNHTISFSSSFCQFRVPNGGMDCQGKVRYWVANGRQVTSIKAVGASCKKVSVKIDSGNGYGGWKRSSNTEAGVFRNLPASRQLERIKYQLCTINQNTHAEVCTFVERVR
jgi:hypothetical protein